MNEKLEWKELWDAMDTNLDQWIPTTKAMYWEMLEVLPPEIMSQTAFLVGEASRHNKDGKAVYSCFKQVNDDYFAKNLTVAEFKNQFTPLKGWVSA